MRKVPLVGVENRVKGGQSHGAYQKQDLQLLQALRPHQEGLLEMEKIKMRVMIGLGTELIMLMLVT